MTEVKAVLSHYLQYRFMEECVDRINEELLWKQVYISTRMYVEMPLSLLCFATQPEGVELADATPTSSKQPSVKTAAHTKDLYNDDL